MDINNFIHVLTLFFHEFTQDFLTEYQSDFPLLPSMLPAVNVARSLPTVAASPVRLTDALLGFQVEATAAAAVRETVGRGLVNLFSKTILH